MKFKLLLASATLAAGTTVLNAADEMRGSDLYRNERLFDRCTATGVRVPAPRAFKDTLIVRIALVNANNPHRHPALGAKRAPIRHLRCRAAVALQRHASSPTGRSAPAAWPLTN